MINYWILKSEPSEWSIDDQRKKGIGPWDGVRNYTARNNMKRMKKGDICLFYHSYQKDIVGQVIVHKEFYEDPDNTKFVIVDVKFDKKFDRYLSLAQMKACPELTDLKLITISRLSVIDITKEQYQQIIRMLESL